jgi:exopolysaccharide production protein ExoQ
MPVIAAFIYPTYMHHMVNPVREWTRLQELPFVFAELGVIIFAIARGLELKDYVAPMPRDIKIAAALFAVGLWVSSILVSKQNLTSIVISASVCVHMLFALSVYHLSGHDRESAVGALPYGLGLGLIALTFLTAWRFLLPPPASQVFGGVIEWGSSLPGFINVRHFGSWSGAIAALFAAFIIGRKVQGELNWCDWFFLLAIGLTIWSGTRAAILAIGVACFIQIISMRRVPSLHTIGRLSILTGAGASVAWLLLPPGAPEFMLFQSASEYSNLTNAGSGRVEMWGLAFNRWLDAPLFGWGSGSTFWEVFIGWPHTQPHNFVLQFLISWGLVGAVGAFWLLGRTVVRAHQIVLRQAELWPLITCLYTLLGMACLEGMLHYPRFIMLIVALLAIILKLGLQDGESHQQLTAA